MALKTGLVHYEPTAEVELDDIETKRPGDYYVTLMGPTNPERKELEERNSDTEKYKVDKRGQFESSLSAKARAKRRLDWLVTCTTGWRNIIGPDDEPLPFSPDNARKLYTAIPAIADQVAAELGDHANFIRRAVPS